MVPMGPAQDKDVTRVGAGGVVGVAQAKRPQNPPRCLGVGRAGRLLDHRLGQYVVGIRVVPADGRRHRAALVKFPATISSSGVNWRSMLEATAEEIASVSS